MAKNKKICIKCISEKVKNYLVTIAPDDNIVKVIEAIPLCLDGKDIEFSSKAGKKASAYAHFIGTCIKDTRVGNNMPVSEAMKECAKVWKTKKK